MQHLMMNLKILSMKMVWMNQIWRVYSLHFHQISFKSPISQKHPLPIPFKKHHIPFKNSLPFQNEAIKNILQCETFKIILIIRSPGHVGLNLGHQRSLGWPSAAAWGVARASRSQTPKRTGSRSSRWSSGRALHPCGRDGAWGSISPTPRRTGSEPSAAACSCGRSTRQW